MLVLRVYAAERIQAQWRGWRLRRHFAPAIASLRILKTKERSFRGALQERAFRDWWTAHNARMERIRGMRREFHSWKSETARLKRISELFRGTFWPMYVWRRWTNGRLSAKDKVLL